MGNTPMG